MDKNQQYKLSSEVQICDFFKETKLEHFVSYNQYKEIFPYDSAFTQKINNRILNGYAHYRNYCMSEMLPYKYIPIAFAAGIQLFRVRPPPIVFPLLFVLGMDYYFLDYMIWKKRNQKIINIQDGFHYKLVKAETQIKRNRFLNKYLEFIRKDPNQKAPEKWIDIGMYTPYIFTHGVFDPQQSYCYLTKEFDIYMSIVHFGTQVLKSMFQTLTQDLKLFMQFKKQRTNQNNKIYQMLDDNIQPIYRIHWMDVLEEKIQLYAQIFNYHMYGTTKKVDWKFEDLTTTRTYIQQTSHKKIRIGSNANEMIIYYSLIALPYILTRFLRRG